MTNVNGWEICERSAPRQSERWAATDRGWYVVDGQPIGNYLDYGPCGGNYAYQSCGSVHAVICGQPIATAWFHSPAEAREWIQKHGKVQR